MVKLLNRWIEDYIQPAIEQKKVKNFNETLEKTRLQVEKKISQKTNKNSKKSESNHGHDPDETETEDSGSECDANVRTKKGSGPTSKAPTRKKKVVRKAKSTKSKIKSKEKNADDLIAAIRNKNGRGNPLASIAAKYGVSNVEDDPLDDAAFTKLKSKYAKK